MKKFISLCLCAVVLFGIVLAAPARVNAITADEIRAMFTDSPREIKDYAYSFAIVGDTQIVTYNDTFSKNNNLSKIYDWLVANKESKKIEFCFGMGDITDTNMPAEWALAHTQISKMDGVLPYTLVRGNHDLPLRYGIPDDTTDYFSLYMGTDTYLEQFQDGRGGMYKNSPTNAWTTFSVGEIDYLVFTLDYGVPDDVIEWCKPIIESHPNHNVILTTHGYMVNGNGGDDGRLSNKDDTYDSSKYTDDSNSGEEMWEKLFSQYANITMVMCGHIESKDITTKKLVGKHGNVVTNIMVNPQNLDAKLKLGAVAMLYFSEDGKNVQLEYYSTVQDAYFKGAERNIEVAVVSADGEITNPSMPTDPTINVTDPTEETEGISGGEATTAPEEAETTTGESQEETTKATESKDSDSSETGDPTNLWLWVALIVISGGAILTLVVLNKKKAQ